jgi:hypothetical protein
MSAAFAELSSLIAPMEYVERRNIEMRILFIGINIQ